MMHRLFTPLKPTMRSLVRLPVRYQSQDVQSRVLQIAELVKNDAELKASFMKMQAIFQAKGLADDKPPSLLQLSKLLMDPEIRNSINLLNDKIKAANIEINPSDFSELFKYYKQQ